MKTEKNLTLKPANTKEWHGEKNQYGNSWSRKLYRNKPSLFSTSLMITGLLPEMLLYFGYTLS